MPKQIREYVLNILPARDFKFWATIYATPDLSSTLYSVTGEVTLINTLYKTYCWYLENKQILKKK